MARRSAATVTAGGAYVSTVTNTRGGGGIALALDEPAASAARLAASSNADAKHDAVGAANARSDAACATIHAADADAPRRQRGRRRRLAPAGRTGQQRHGNQTGFETGLGTNFVPRDASPAPWSARRSPWNIAAWCRTPRRRSRRPRRARRGRAWETSCAAFPRDGGGDVPRRVAGARERESHRPPLRLRRARAYAGSAAATRNVAADDSDSATVSSFAFAAAARHLGTISRRNLRRAATGTADRKTPRRRRRSINTRVHFRPWGVFRHSEDDERVRGVRGAARGGFVVRVSIPSWTSTATTFTPTTNASGGADAETNATPFSKAYHAPASAPSPASTSSSAVGSSVSRKRSTPSIRGARSRGPNANAGSNA